MNGIQNPTIWRFIDALKKDEDIARVKMLSCRSGLPAAPKKRKDVAVDDAIKKIVATYLTDTEADDEKNSYEEEQEDENDVGEAAGGEELSSREKWLLSAIANVSRLWMKFKSIRESRLSFLLDCSRFSFFFSV